MTDTRDPTMMENGTFDPPDEVSRFMILYAQRMHD